MRNVLSNTEFYILQYLWSLETPTTFAEIMVHFTEEGKTWKKQTVNTFLSRMIQKGYLKSDKTKGPRAVYSPVFTKKEFHEKYAKDIVEDYYDNSILEFVRAYTAGHKLDDTSYPLTSRTYKIITYTKDCQMAVPFFNHLRN